MYCKVCGKKLDGTERFCSDCGSPIDYADMVGAAVDAMSRTTEDGFRLSKSGFHMDNVDWDLEGYPIDDKKTDRVDFDWASVLEGKEKKAAEERRRAIAMTEDDIYERIQSDRHNDEFDWNLVHTMRIDRHGKSGLSLFHEDDEELFSVDFIPPLNTADSYANMVPEEKKTAQPRGTIVIDRIDKSGIEDAANQAAGIKERDYAALGAATAQAVGADAPGQPPRKIEKFYTFNRKNEEFHALLEAEYERIKQKVQQADKEEEKATAEIIEAVEEVLEPTPMTRGEVAKASAEAEADEAERLAAEAERLAAEAEAKAKAAEEAAAKAAAEAKAAEEALKAKEEEEVRAAEEAARKAAEEEAARKAAEEAARKVAEEEATRKAEAEAEEALRAAEEKTAAAELAAVAATEAKEEADEATAARVAEEINARELEEKKALEDEAAKLAEEEAAIDAELEKLNESHKALEVEAAKIEAGLYDNEDVIEDVSAVEQEEKRMNYVDIFEDEDDDEYEGRRGGCKTLFLDLLIVILALAVAAGCFMIFKPEHSISKRLRSLIPFLSGENVPVQEGPVDTGNNPASTPEPEPEPEPEPQISDTAAAIKKLAASFTNLGEISEDQALLFTSGTDYGLEGVEQATMFTNGAWYTNSAGESVTYTDAVVGTIVEYYSKLMDKLNNDSDEVMELVAEDSQLYGELSAISANPDVTHSIDSLKVGEIRANSSDFYVLVNVSEQRSSEESPEVTTKVIYLQADDADKEMKIMNIVDVQ